MVVAPGWRGVGARPTAELVRALDRHDQRRVIGQRAAVEHLGRTDDLHAVADEDVVNVAFARVSQTDRSRGSRRLKSPPTTSGAPAAHRSEVRATSSPSRWRANLVAGRVDVDDPEARPRATPRGPSGALGSARAAACGGRRSGRGGRGSRSRRRRLTPIRSGQRVAIARRAASRPLREVSTNRYSASSSAPRPAGHHGGTSWSSATSHSQPPRAAVNSRRRSRPADGWARPCIRFHVSTRKRITIVGTYTAALAAPLPDRSRADVGRARRRCSPGRPSSSARRSLRRR